MWKKKTLADQTAYSLESHRQSSVLHTAGTVKSEDVHAVGQTEHMARSSGYANTAVAHCNHVEEVQAQEESMEGAMWKTDKDT